MRIGIWCDYGTTLGPTEGIGVFVDNLARGLVRADPDCQLSLVAHPHEEHVLESTVRGGLGRIQVVSAIRSSKLKRSIARTVRKLRRILQRRMETSPFLKSNSTTAQRSIFDRLDGWLDSLYLRTTRQERQSIHSLIQACDLWLVPYVGLEQEFSRPTVVVIHDLVSYHFPEMLRYEKLQLLKTQVNRIAGQSMIAACMSDFIRDHDLIGTLDLPPERVRVIKSAVPDDICNSVSLDEKKASQWLALKNLTEPYLFYPAAFRTYKNHRYLVDAIHLLKQRSSSPWKLVFTGIDGCPADLLKQIAALNLQDDLVVPGRVSRDELRILYQNAFATIVPSLYEQGSFPVMEALSLRCPVAASDIPSLREQFSPLGSSMLFFDPHVPESLLPVVELIERNRNAIVNAQSVGFSCMKEYTWTTAAKDWMALFRETLTMSERIETVLQLRRSA